MLRVCFCIIILTTVLAATLPLDVRAQSNPPFKNPSLDSNCYFPQIGVAGEIDTIYGDSANEGLGGYIHNLGQLQNGAPGNMLIGNGSSVPFVDWNETRTGPTFNLHDLKAKAQKLNLDPTSIKFGHFHNSTSIDIFDYDAWVIYWADENGNYDTAHKTELLSNILGSNGYSTDAGTVFIPYLAPLSDDTVDDIVAGLYMNNFPNKTSDSLFLLYYRGGSHLWSTAMKSEDTSAYFGIANSINGDFSNLQGDFRGTGRQDLLIADEQNTFYFFQNDPPFSLSNLANAIRFDTLCPRAVAARTFWTPVQPSTAIVMPLLPKKKGDHSIDFALVIPDSNSINNMKGSIYIFRGGSEFGSHRLTLDSAAYVIKAPDLGYQNWPGFLTDAGDMTGTGNHVLYTEGGSDYADQNYYVTGQALDDKIDMFYRDCAAGFGDTMTANNDSLEDLLLGNEAYDDPQDGSNLEYYHGTIWLMYGSKNIPVHLDPQFADVKDIPQVNGAGITLAPNPISQSWSVATIIWPEAENAEYEVYNILGSIVQSGTIRLLGGAEEQRIYFANLPNGTYIFVVHGLTHEARTKLVIAR